jgi:hypothetical protein
VSGDGASITNALKTMANENLPVSIRERASMQVLASQGQLSTTELDNLLFGAKTTSDQTTGKIIQLGNTGILGMDNSAETVDNVINLMPSGKNAIVAAVLLDLKDGDKTFTQAWNEVLGDEGTDVSSADKNAAFALLVRYANNQGFGSGAAQPSTVNVTGTTPSEQYFKLFDQIDWKAAIEKREKYKLTLPTPEVSTATYGIPNTGTGQNYRNPSGITNITQYNRPPGFVGPIPKPGG